VPPSWPARNPQRTRDLAAHGVDHPLVDDGAVAGQVRKIVPEGVHAALELVGTPALRDTLAAVRVHGTVCFTGMLSDQWTVRDFYPIGYLPNGVRLTAYSGDAADLPAAVLQSYLDRIASGEISLVPVHIYNLDDIHVAHRDLEEGRKVGKLVGRTTGR
jgi:NADPH:quinone reductase